MTSAQEKLPIKMLNDRVLVKIPSADGERRSMGGILIPATAQVSKRLVWAQVVALGQNVRAADNAAVMDSALRAAGSPDSRVIVYPRGNHVLMEARTGTPREAGALQRFVPGYFDTLTEIGRAHV